VCSEEKGDEVNSVIMEVSSTIVWERAANEREKTDENVRYNNG
jgi:hypothetical protein